MGKLPTTGRSTREPERHQHDPAAIVRESDRPAISRSRELERGGRNRLRIASIPDIRVDLRGAHTGQLAGHTLRGFKAFGEDRAGCRGDVGIGHRLASPAVDVGQLLKSGFGRPDARPAATTTPKAKATTTASRSGTVRIVAVGDTMIGSDFPSPILNSALTRDASPAKILGPRLARLLRAALLSLGDVAEPGDG